MSVHQIIYTSCMRGINGVNDGQQIFSYDAQFKDSSNDEIKNLFSYQPPVLEPGVIMTEEIATTLPQAFIYRKLENGKCALALSTYLGRDYMGSAGRFGNHLSHVVVADEVDVVHYPCEFYGGALLRNRMEFEEVNNPDPPDFLPIPILEKGYIVDVDSVLEFLSIGDRLEIYKNMLHAMLAFERERKRVVICDASENIVMWIAALEYALPLKTALGINFTTYEFDPTLSAAQICGVVRRGTRYTADSGRLHFVFDIEQSECVRFEKDAEFYDFIDTAFSLSFESVRDFHAFLAEGYTYEKANEEIYSAYALYSLLSDGIKGFTKKRLISALDFADKYAFFSEKDKIVKKLLSEDMESIEIDREVFLAVMRYTFSVRDVLESTELITAERAIVDRILGELRNYEITEDSFDSFYNDADSMCKRYHFELVTELMQDDKREKLFSIIQNGVSTWKIVFIVKVVSTYAKEHNMSVSELTSNKLLGHAYYDILRAVFSQCPQNGFLPVTCILNEFAYDSSELTNMALIVEEMLLDIPGGEMESVNLWKYYGQTMVSQQKDNFSIVYDILTCHERHEQVFMLFRLQLQDASDVMTSQQAFTDHFNDFAQKNSVYASKYSQNILTMYFDKLSEFEEGQTRTAKTELFDILVSSKVDIEFADGLIAELLREIPYKSPSKQNLQILQNIFQYIRDFRGNSVTGKLLLMQVGMMIEDISNHEQLEERMSQLEVLTQDGKADLTGLSEKAVEDYFAWLLPTICGLCQKNDEMCRVYNLFYMSSEAEKGFFSESAKLYLKQCREDKEHGVFAEYLCFVCTYVYDNVQIREVIGRTLCKLSKNKLAELDKAIREKCDTGEQFIKYWEDVRKTAETTNPLFNNISNLFRRRKRED